MDPGVERKCKVLALYLAARGSNKLSEYLRDLTDARIEDARLKWQMDETVIREVADYLRGEGDRKPVNRSNPDREDPEPCPHPPCERFVGAIFDAVQNNVSG